MLYLCGWDAPEAIFMAYQESGSWVTSIFVRPRDTKAEIWEGRRVGVEGASSQWPIDEAHSLNDMETIIIEKINSCNNIYSIIGVNESLDDITKNSDIEILEEIKAPTPSPYPRIFLLAKSKPFSPGSCS